MITMRVKKLRDNAKLPTYAFHGDAGMDFYAIEECWIAPGKILKVPLGVAVEFFHNHDASDVGKYLALELKSKSGRALKEGLHVLTGTVDQSYRGELNAILHNISDKTIIIHKGEKVIQGTILEVPFVTIIEASILSETRRGDGGFGHTGTN